MRVIGTVAREVDCGLFVSGAWVGSGGDRWVCRRVVKVRENGSNRVCMCGQSERDHQSRAVSRRRVVTSLSMLPFAAVLDARKQIFADAMVSSMDDYERFIRAEKLALFEDAFASEAIEADHAFRVLDVGIGTAPNLALLPRNVTDVVGIDPNPYMLEYARRSVSQLPAGRFRSVTLLEGRANDIQLENGSIDGAICTLVMCSVPDISQLLTALARVVRPGGTLAFIEHVAAEPSRRPMLFALQHILDPIQVIAADGCHLCRRTERALRQSSPLWRIERIERIDLPPSIASLISPHILGFLRRTGTQLTP